MRDRHWLIRVLILLVAVVLTAVIGMSSLIGSARARDRRISVVISRGNVLVRQVESFRRSTGRYPRQLNELSSVPKTGLGDQRRFYYASAKGSSDDKGPWFPSTRAYLGNAGYVICVPLVPSGTLIYRPNSDYPDLQGRRLGDGWFHTTRD